MFLCFIVIVCRNNIVRKNRENEENDVVLENRDLDEIRMESFKDNEMRLKSDTVTSDELKMKINILQ